LVRYLENIFCQFLVEDTFTIFMLLYVYNDEVKKNIPVLENLIFSLKTSQIVLIFWLLALNPKPDSDVGGKLKAYLCGS
jgi:hypothetical protein